MCRSTKKMTASPTTKTTANGNVDAEGLQIERASSVGWLFIQSYYDMYNKNYENFHMLYHAEGSLSHSAFPEDGEKSESTPLNTVLKATGTDGIKARFLQDASLKLKNNSIVVTSADFQVSLKKNILIVVAGEWSRNGSPYWQFNQTFLLTPGKKANSYDVANDVLKFVDFKEFSEDKEVVESIANSNSVASEASAAATATATTTALASTTETNPTVEADTKEQAVVEEEPTANETVEPKAIATPPTKSEEKKIEPPKPQSTTQEPPVAEKETEKVKKPETAPVPEVAKVETNTPVLQDEAVPVTEVQDEAVDSSATNSVSSSSTAATAASKKSDPRQPMSWAALASQAAEKEGAAPPVAKPVKASASAPASAASSTAKKTSSPETSEKRGNGKDDWFPIYIRGIKNLDDNVVKNYLVDNFGSVLLFKPLINIALCDFATEEGQRRALEAGKATIDGITFDLEKRESRKDGASASVNGSPFAGKKGKDPKDKQPDAKRNKSDKKQNPKKRPGAKHQEAF